MNLDLFDAGALRPLVNFLNRNGISSQSLLGNVSIPEELVDLGGWVTKNQAYDFTLDVVRRLRSPAAVYRAYLENFHLDHLGPIAGAMRACKTVKESLDVAARLGELGFQGSEYFLRIDGDTTWFCYGEPRGISEGQEFISDMTLTIYWHLIRITANDDWQPEQMVIHHGSGLDRHRTTERFADCRASYHSRYSALAFPTEFLSRRVPWQRNDHQHEASHAWKHAPDGSKSVADSLYRLLASRLHYRRLPTQQQVAALFNTSPSTLKRQLAEAGVSYRALLDRVRFDAACDMLIHSDLPLSEIAHELDYSGTNNFVRSFRRMTGTTPRQYRGKLSSV